ncbi:hypothetical protein CR513_51572, partial [Mucuna pruriens]
MTILIFNDDHYVATCLNFKELLNNIMLHFVCIREDMAHKLQKDGPLVFRSLTEKYILQLVELLISKKKWLEESPSQTFPFRLTQAIRQNLLIEHHSPSCKNQLNMMWRNPEGYSMSSFPKLFVDRYGYHLDLQKLGYQKLASLLQIMPDLKVESTYIFPFVSASEGETFYLKTQVTDASHAHAISNSDSELSDSAPKDDNMESPWEKLGPVSVNSSNQSNMESKLSQKAKELETSKRPHYEPIGSDYNSSESEGDSSYLNQPRRARIAKM